MIKLSDGESYLQDHSTTNAVPKAPTAQALEQVELARSLEQIAQGKLLVSASTYSSLSGTTRSGLEQLLNSWRKANGREEFASGDRAEFLETINMIQQTRSLSKDSAQFQEKAGLVPDGCMGPRTFRVLAQELEAKTRQRLPQIALTEFKSVTDGVWDLSQDDGTGNFVERASDRHTSSSLPKLSALAHTSDRPILHSSTHGLNGDVPLFKQNDQRWGALSYGHTSTIARSGCGPTSMAMILAARGYDVNPADMVRFAEQHRYRIAGKGTSWAFFADAAQQYGLETEVLGSSLPEIDNALQQGPVIVSVKRSKFTSNGHFVVVTGFENGKYQINDPGGRNVSEATPAELSRALKRAWSFRETAVASNAA